MVWQWLPSNLYPVLAMVTMSNFPYCGFFKLSSEMGFNSSVFLGHKLSTHKFQRAFKFSEADFAICNDI